MKRIICLMLCLSIIIAAFTAVAEEYRVFIFCNPKSSVMVRRSPKKRSEVSGRLEFGDWVLTDGVKQNGFLHVLGITEYGEGWIFAGNTVEDQPQKLEKARANVAASGRVMSYRWVAGRKNKWLKVGAEVKVYGWSDEWAVTNKGYIRTEYLEVWYE